MNNFKVSDREALMLHQLRRRLRESALLEEEHPEWTLLYTLLAFIILIVTIGVICML